MDRWGIRSWVRGGFGLLTVSVGAIRCWIYVWVGNARGGSSRMALA
jgi:hypothetical protein